MEWLWEEGRDEIKGVWWLLIEGCLDDVWEVVGGWNENIMRG